MLGGARGNASLLDGTPRQRTLWLRSATDRTLEALKQREVLEGSDDLDEVRKTASFLVKVALARSSSPVTSEPAIKKALASASSELTKAGIVLASVPPVPSRRGEMHDAIEHWARSTALAALVAEFDGRPCTGPLGALLDRLDDFSSVWDYRAGKERNLVATPASRPPPGASWQPPRSRSAWSRRQSRPRGTTTRY